MFAYMHLCKERSNTQYIHIYIHANPGSFFFFISGRGDLTAMVKIMN